LTQEASGVHELDLRLGLDPLDAGYAGDRRQLRRGRGDVEDVVGLIDDRDAANGRDGGVHGGDVGLHAEGVDAVGLLAGEVEQAREVAGGGREPRAGLVEDGGAHGRAAGECRALAGRGAHEPGAIGDHAGGDAAGRLDRVQGRRLLAGARLHDPVGGCTGGEGGGVDRRHLGRDRRTLGERIERPAREAHEVLPLGGEGGEGRGGRGRRRGGRCLLCGSRRLLRAGGCGEQAHHQREEGEDQDGAAGGHAGSLVRDGTRAVPARRLVLRSGSPRRSVEARGAAAPKIRHAPRDSFLPPAHRVSRSAASGVTRERTLDGGPITAVAAPAASEPAVAS
jgi:hypothetical protein